MFADNNFKAAVFIGGMGGVIDEFNLFQKLQPNKDIVPVISTGGATLKVAELMNEPLDSDLYNDLDYVRLFHNSLGISTKEERFASPEIQPVEMEDCYWKPD